MAQDLWTILHVKLSVAEVNRRFETLKKFSKMNFPKDGCFAIEWLSTVVKRIDELWYDAALLPQLTAAYGGLRLSMEEEKSSRSNERVAGYVTESGNRKHITLHMNRNLFATLFNSIRNPKSGFHSGGLLCKERLVCFLHVLLHETVHLVLTLLEKVGFRKDIRDHGKDFNEIVLNLFGQTDSQHGLIRGYEQFDDLNTLKKTIHKGSKVEIFVNEKWLPGVVEKKGYKWLMVRTEDKKRLKLHVGLLRRYSEPTAN